MTTFDKEATRLAKLPRAERFRELLQFPTNHTFKVIGRATGLVDGVTRILDARARGGACLTERPSATGKYLSVTFTLAVQTAEELDELYLELEALPGLSCLL